MRRSVPDYTFRSDRQAVVDALTGVIQKGYWHLLPGRTKALLVVVTVLRDPDRYYAPDGYLKDSLNIVVGEVFTGLPCALRTVLSCLQLNRLTEGNGKASHLHRSRPVVTDEIRGILSDLGSFAGVTEGRRKELRAQAAKLCAGLGSGVEARILAMNS